MNALIIGALAVTAPLAARGQDSPIVGVWSWQASTPTGPVQSTVALRPDGTYIWTDRVPTGSLVRQWGHYSAIPTGAGAVQLQTQPDGYLPHTSCVIVTGMGQRCNAAPPPPPNSAMLVMTSPMTMQSQGVTLQRDPSGGLLNLQVPDTAMVTMAAPPQPDMQAPVMPHITPYQTPNYAGNQMANAYHQNNQNFTNGYMRGCVKDMYGNWVGCQQ